VPNDLLVPLDKGWIDISEINRRVVLPADRRVLLVITTNGERELAPAFLRRCVQLELEAPGAEQLQQIAELHHGPDEHGLYGEVARQLLSLREEASMKRTRAPSTAEFLDAIQACLQLNVRPGKSPTWSQLSASLLEKHSTLVDG
jgi:MoxR-like ATPase